LPARAGAAGPEVQVPLQAGGTPQTVTVRARPGIRLMPVHAPLALGDESRRLRVVDAAVRDGVYVARLQGRTGRTYQARLDVPFPVTGIEGATEVGREGTVRTLTISIPAGAAEWADLTLRVRLGK
jgi:hypothetical protein